MRLDIGQMLGWKFNHQEGMVTTDGVIIKFPGGIPSSVDVDKWFVEYDSHMDTTKYKRDRAKEYSVKMPLELQLEAIIEQMQADKDAGKIMVPAMENILGIDSDIKMNNQR